MADVERLEAVEEKVEAILQMDWPRDATALRGFIGAVNFTKICAQVMHTYLLEPLTNLSELKKRQKIKWTPEMEKAFKK